MSDYTLLVYLDFPEEAQLIHREEEKFRDVPKPERFAVMMHLLAFGHSVIEASPRRDEIRAMLHSEQELGRDAFRKLIRDFQTRRMADSLMPHTPADELA